MTVLLPDATAVERALRRRDLIFGLTVDQAMGIFGPVLEEYAREIARLRAEAKDGSEEER